MIPDFTLVIGVDRKHLQQLYWVWPTWEKHKPSLLSRPILIFYDSLQVDPRGIFQVAGDRPNISLVPWHTSTSYSPGLGKWDDPQRAKMLAGFIYAPLAVDVQTPYLLKLDTDVVATGQDNWIDPTWFEGSPAIISHPWGFTKPADQIDKLDAWAESNQLLGSPLNLHPKEGWSRVRHPRIISWCCFTRTSFSHALVQFAAIHCGYGKLPVPSHDGYLWYMAARYKEKIVRTSMKVRGWQQWSTDANVRLYAQEALRNG